MSSRTITESFQMRKNISREEKCTKRRLIDNNHDTNSSEQFRTVEGQTNQITRNGPQTKTRNIDKNNFKNPVVDLSPIFQSQKEIAWNTVSPDCFQRLKPRVLDDAKIHENAENTMKSYMSVGAKPKQPKDEILDSWLSKTDNVLSHPTTPKISKTTSRRNICKQSNDKTMEAKRMLEKSNLKFLFTENKPNTSKKEDVIDKKDDSFDDVWEEDALFNDSGFLAATQQVEEKYRQNKSNTQIEISSNLQEKVTLEVHNASISRLNSIQENSTCKIINNVDKIEISKESGIGKTDDKPNVTNDHSNEQRKLDDSWDDEEEFDEIDQFMCTVVVPQSQTAIEDVPTQVFNPENSIRPELNNMPEKILNNSFEFDSDDSFGADFQM